MTKKVLVTERLAEAGLAVLRDKGCEVDVKLKMTPEELIETVPGYDALIVRSATKVTAEVVEAADRLRIIGRAGVGVDNVDVEAATEHGIIVCNAQPALRPPACRPLRCRRPPPTRWKRSPRRRATKASPP